MCSTGAPERDHWRRYDEVADVLRSRTDDDWETDRELVDQNLLDPWEQKGMRALLDTSVLIEGLDEPVDAGLAISTISLAELHFGVLVAKSAEIRAARLRRLAGIERAFAALPVTDAVARTCGSFAATVAATGRQPRAGRSPSSSRPRQLPTMPSSVPATRRTLTDSTTLVEVVGL